MNEVTFPGLNLKFNISQIAFSLFNVDIYMYALCILTGIIIALLICKINKNKFGNEFEDVIENLAVGLFFGIIGARLYFIIFNLNHYKNNMISMFNIRDGGLAIYGGLILGSIAIWTYTKIKKKCFLDLLDYAIPSLAIAQSIGRFGNFFNLEAFGYETSSLFRMGITTYSKGYIEVHPTFLYESICDFIICILLLKLQNKRKYKGQIILYYLMFYSFIRFFIEGLRQDSLMFFDFRVSQILSIVIFIICVISLFVENCSTKNEANNEN